MSLHGKVMYNRNIKAQQYGIKNTVSKLVTMIIMNNLQGRIRVVYTRLWHHCHPTDWYTLSPISHSGKPPLARWKDLCHPATSPHPLHSHLTCISYNIAHDNTVNCICIHCVRELPLIYEKREIFLQKYNLHITVASN